MHLEFLLEEPSTEAFLSGLLPRFLPRTMTWRFVVFRGKKDLLAKLPKRLKAYRQWLPDDHRLIVLVDEDRQDCRLLKQRLEQSAAEARLPTKSAVRAGEFFVLINRIVVEELEAWYFGDVTAITNEFPGVSLNLGNQAKFRDSDTITGGTWEAFERVLQSAGHYPAGLSKIDAARRLGLVMTPLQNRSGSFRQFLSALNALFP